MDDNMKRLLMPLLFAAANSAGAQAVQDPTRPPQALIKPVAGAASAGAPQLQSILVARGPGGRRVAVIDGNMVRIGDMVGGARVTGMTASSVQLQRGGKRETLKMTAPEEDVPLPIAAAATAAQPTALPPGAKPE
jgi:MSHA biogenesis protein MshK